MTTDIVRIAAIALFWLFFGTNRHGVVAAVTERAAGRQIARIGHHALNRLELFLAVIQIRQRIKQTLCVWVTRMLIDIAQRSVLNHGASIYNRDLITDLSDYAQVMRNHQQRGLVLLL